MKSLPLILGLLAAVQALPAKGSTPLDVTIPVIEGAPVPIPLKIVGGKEANLGQFPHHACIVIDRSSYCGGSLIATDWILTAAHCVQGRAIFEVILGRVKWKGKGGESIAAWEKIVHGSYNNETKANDIALLRLSRYVTLTDNIKLVTLTNPEDVSNTFAGVMAQLSGIGFTKTNGSVSKNLMWVEMPVITNDECAQNNSTKIISSMLCTSGERGKGGCNGDSGGALVIIRNGGFTQIGVAFSSHIKDCAAGYPTAYTRVTAYRDWIKQKSRV